ncbi:MAG TPA: YihY/virulence factor BrkB family protein [Candidatus Acidoferrales bacterium]|nr:YihY/virulence factor BrkB family protein [Candidatus Acidoferrales bacterium]
MSPKATSSPQVPSKPHLRLLTRAIGQAIYNTVRAGSLLHAQAVAFNMFMAFFPALLFLAGIVAYATPELEEFLNGLRVVLPPGSRRAVVETMLRISQNPGRLLWVGAVGTMLVGSQLMFSLRQVFAIIYDREERGPFWRQQLESFAMVLITVVPWVAVSLLVVFGRLFRTWLSAQLGVDLSVGMRLLWNAGYFSLAIVTATLVLGTLYYFLTPNVRRRWDDVLPGAALAMGLWWIVTTAFGFYVTRVAIYDEVYGGFGAAIGLLVWMYLSAVVILIGAQFNAEMASLRSRYDLY